MIRSNWSRRMGWIWGAGLILVSCAPAGGEEPLLETGAQPQFTLTADQTHNRFSSKIPPALRVPSGAVVEAYTREASDGQLTVDSRAEDLLRIDESRIHPLTGPVYVEGAEVGDILAVSLLEIEVGDWGWTAILPGFGFLAEQFSEPVLRTWRIPKGAREIPFAPGISLPIRPFAGVMGVAPDTEEMLRTIPPRANGGNMDNRYLTEGTTVYFPVWVEGALFSIGDTHAAQGDGEVCGTGVEAPMRIVYRVEVIKDRPAIAEPQYETADFYAVTAFAPTIDEAAKKATRYMIEHLVSNRGMAPEEAYMLCSLAGDLKISEVVDLPHVLVSMHIPKSIFAPRG